MQPINTLEEARKHSLSTRQRYETLYRIMRIRKQRLLPIAVSPLTLRVEKSYQERQTQFLGWRNNNRYLYWVRVYCHVTYGDQYNQRLPF